MSNLVLHCGASNVQAVDVERATTPRGTETHYPIPHAELVEVTKNVAEAGYGLEIVNEAHGMTHDGDRYFGLFEFRAGLNMPYADYAPVIGLRNSHDMAFSASLAIGSSVFVCDNLAFSGEVRISRKHTRNIMRDLPLMVERAFGALGTLRAHMDRRIEAYKATSFSGVERDHVLMQAARYNALSWSGLGKVVKELDQPTHVAGEFGVSEDSAWFLFNACTEVLKTRSRNEPDPRWTQFLHRVFDQAVDLPELETDIELAA